MKSFRIILALMVAAAGPAAPQAAPVFVSLDARVGAAFTTGDFGDDVDGGIVIGVGAAVQVHPRVSLLFDLENAFLEQESSPVFGDPLPLALVAGTSVVQNEGRNVNATRLIGGVGIHLTDRTASRFTIMPRAEFGMQIFDFDQDTHVAAAISGGITFGYDVSRTVSLQASVRVDGSFVDEGSFTVNTEQVLMIPVTIGASVRLD